MKVSPWLPIMDEFEGEPYLAGVTRICEGGDINDINDRVAFIEKTPRIRIRRCYKMELEQRRSKDYLNWAERDWKGDGPDDPESMKWCDDALKLFGYEGV